MRGATLARVRSECRQAVDDCQQRAVRVAAGCGHGEMPRIESNQRGKKNCQLPESPNHSFTLLRYQSLSRFEDNAHFEINQGFLLKDVPSATILQIRAPGWRSFNASLFRKSPSKTPDRFPESARFPNDPYRFRTFCGFWFCLHYSLPVWDIPTGMILSAMYVLNFSFVESLFVPLHVGDKSLSGTGDFRSYFADHRTISKRTGKRSPPPFP